MNALAKCWTWIGFAFVPLAIGWAIYLRGGLSDQPPALGVLISRGYAGLLVSLIAGCALIWVLALYVRAARKQGVRTLVPPNTMFEEMDKRHTVISWATLVIFLGALCRARRIQRSVFRKFGPRLERSAAAGHRLLGKPREGASARLPFAALFLDGAAHRVRGARRGHLRVYPVRHRWRSELFRAAALGGRRLLDAGLPAT